MNPIKFILTNRVLLALIEVIVVNVLTLGIDPWLNLLIILASVGFLMATWSIVYEGGEMSCSEEILLEWLERKFD